MADLVFRFVVIVSALHAASVLLEISMLPSLFEENLWNILQVIYFAKTFFLYVGGI